MKASFQCIVSQHLAAETGNTSRLMKAPSLSTRVPRPGSAKSSNSGPINWNSTHP